MRPDAGWEEEKVKLVLQGFTVRPFPGLENFVPAVAYHFCLSMPVAFSQLGNGLKVEPRDDSFGVMQFDFYSFLTQFLV